MTDKSAHGFVYQGVEFISMCGEAGLGRLRALAKCSDLRSLKSWVPAGSDPHQGNCFFASTQMMIDLARSGVCERFSLVTGLFDHGDVDPVVHAWLELRKPGASNRDDCLVFNVSNVPHRPVYAIGRAEYLRINSCSTIFQTLSGRVIMMRAAQFLGVKRAELPGALAFLDVRAFAKSLLGQTMREVPSGPVIDHSSAAPAP